MLLYRFIRQKKKVHFKNCSNLCFILLSIHPLWWENHLEKLLLSSSSTDWHYSGGLATPFSQPLVRAEAQSPSKQFPWDAIYFPCQLSACQFHDPPNIGLWPTSDSQFGNHFGRHYWSSSLAELIWWKAASLFSFKRRHPPKVENFLLTINIMVNHSFLGVICLYNSVPQDIDLLLQLAGHWYSIQVTSNETQTRKFWLMNCFGQAEQQAD